jgi:hypothetical protein
MMIERMIEHQRIQPCSLKAALAGLTSTPSYFSTPKPPRNPPTAPKTNTLTHTTQTHLSKLLLSSVEARLEAKLVSLPTLEAAAPVWPCLSNRSWLNGLFSSTEGRDSGVEKVRDAGACELVNEYVSEYVSEHVSSIFVEIRASVYGCVVSPCAYVHVCICVCRTIG